MRIKINVSGAEHLKKIPPPPSLSDRFFQKLSTFSLCQLPFVGHDWWEIPRTFRITRRNSGERLQFKCKRCGQQAGWTA